MTQTQSRDGFLSFSLTSLQLAQRPLAAARNQKGFETEKHMGPKQFDCSNISQKLVLSKQAPGRINHMDLSFASSRFKSSTEMAIN